MKTTPTFAVLFICASVLVCGVWAFQFADPCLAERLTDRFAATDVVPPPTSTGIVETLDRPGLVACDHWPTWGDSMVSLATLVLSQLALGFFAGRFAPSRPYLIAACAGIVGFSMVYILQSFSAFATLAINLIDWAIGATTALAGAVAGSWLGSLARLRASANCA
jgi:hypothetical protein